MKNIVGKIKRYKYFFCIMLLIITQVFVCVELNKKQIETVSSYNGIDEGTSQILTYSDGNDLKNIIEKNDVFQKISLQDGDKLSQKIWINSLSINQLQMIIQTVQGDSFIDVSLKDENGKQIYSDTINIVPEKIKYNLNIESNRYSKCDRFSLDMKVHSNNDDLSIYSCTYHDGSLKINNESNDNVLLTGIIGTNERYESKKIAFFSMIEIFVILLILCCNYKDQGVVKKIDGLFKIKKVNFYIIEWLAFLGLLLLTLKVFCSWYYEVLINPILFLIDIYLIALFIFAIFIAFIKFKDNVAYIFGLFIIPIGLCFTFLILPGSVPDEPVHFAKAYLTSQFNFSFIRDVKITTKYLVTEIRNYNDILPAIFQFDNYKSLTLYQNACSYHFILYIFSAIPLFITRILHLSVYFGFYCGRMMNLLIFIIIGYNILKIIPFGKWVFFVYFFNPMLIQQEMSFSSDSLINTICLLAIAYFLKMKFNSDKIETIDIIIVFTMIGIVFLAKYIYLPIFGIYFLLFDKLKRMTINQYAICILMVLLIFTSYYYTSLLKVNAQTIESLDNYVKVNNVNQSAQIKFLLSNPKNIFYMYVETLNNKFDFYVKSFIGMLGVLAIPLNRVSFYGYYGLLFGTPILFEETKNKKFKLSNRIWLVFLSLFVFMLVILGMNFQWTPVGKYVTEGVQGRYFIPVVILLLIALIPPKKLSKKRANFIISIIIIFIHLFVLINIVRYFM